MKDRKRMVAFAGSLGFDLHDDGRGGHLKFRLRGRPDTPQVVISTTPSDRRGWRNAQAMLRRVALDAQAVAA